MANTRKKKDQTPMPPAAPPVEAPRADTNDRHKDRNQVSLKTPLYEAFVRLAKRNKRPTSWEIRIALRKWLADHAPDLLPPEDDSDA